MFQFSSFDCIHWYYPLEMESESRRYQTYSYLRVSLAVKASLHLLSDAHFLIWKSRQELGGAPLRWDLILQIHVNNPWDLLCLMPNWNIRRLSVHALHVEKFCTDILHTHAALSYSTAVSLLLASSVYFNMDNELQVLLALLSMIAAVVKLNSAFLTQLQPAHAGVKLLLEHFNCTTVTKQPILCFLFIPANACQISV